MSLNKSCIQNFLPILLFLLPSCKKNNSETPSGSHDVYVIGFMPGSLSPKVATLWKNGTAITLGKDSLNNVSTANGIFIQDTDIYVCGAATDSTGNGAACYWKNGAITQISYTGPHQSSYAVSVFVSGTDVYMSGAAPVLGTSAASSWKNTTTTTLSNSGYSVANAIAVSGSDVYIAGQDPNAVFWKNGIETPLFTKYPYSASHANSMLIHGNDVFISGDEADDNGAGIANFAGYWKNNVPTHIGILDSNRVTSIFVTDGHVYLGGSKEDNNGNFFACYWDNGKATIITQQNYSQANAIYVVGNDVYTAGFAGSSAVCWKNKTATYLSGTTLNGIFVK